MTIQNTPQPIVALETLYPIQLNSMTSSSNRNRKKRRIVRFDVESTPPGKRTRPGPPSPSFFGVPLPPVHNQRHAFGHNTRPASPPNTSPRQCQIHPLLNGEAYGSDLCFDIVNPAFAPLRRVGPYQMVMLSNDELREHATFPPIINMCITHDVIPQWPIRLNLAHGEYDIGDPLPLTVGDILYMIHSSLHRRISRQDWARLDQSEKTAIARAYTRRCMSIPSLAEIEAGQGVKRVDYLMDRHVFRGLRVAEGDSSYHWKLLT
jgi:hypothetical protein